MNIIDLKDSGKGTGLAAQRHVPPPAVAKAKPKAQPKRGNSFARLVQDEGVLEGRFGSLKLPDCATTSSPAGVVNPSYFVPVSFVAKDWNVTPRRIRSLLAAERLAGRQGENGYWEVAYPYRFIIGTRGPVLKRQQKPKRGRPKSAGSAE